MCKIIDIFPVFQTYWADAEHKSVEDQIESWAKEYMLPWPELLSKQIEDYAAQNLIWQQVAREKVFPHLAERLPAMQEAHGNLLELCKPIYSKAQNTLCFESSATFVIYVGIGCGAGWVTTFCGSPAILFGLENIAESGWSDPDAITGLIAHEIGHLVHYHWRSQHGKPIGSGPFWQLYEEGFAQDCECRIRNTEIVHQAKGSKDDDWIEWCQAHAGRLAAEFLKTVDSAGSVSPFFGSWFEIGGKSETGYFLGQEVVKEMEKRLTLKEIALLDNVDDRLRSILDGMVKRGRY
jgi:hypothetical protein